MGVPSSSSRVARPKNPAAPPVGSSSSMPSPASQPVSLIWPSTPATSSQGPDWTVMMSAPAAAKRPIQ